MNYLEEIQRLKRAEEEKKAKLARIKADKEKNKDEYLSNVTFYWFEKYFILMVIPRAIEQGINNKIVDTTNIKCSYFDDNLNRDEILEYIRNIPGFISMDNIEGGLITQIKATFELESLATYYYEKLQEFEYYGIDYSECKSR